MANDSPKILLLEDDPLLSDITSFRLEMLGFEVDCRGTPEDTFDWLKEHRPDIVILDIAMCGNEGLDLLNRLSNDQQYGDIPVLVFSTSADLDAVQRAFAAGADEFLVTPYDPSNLEHKLEKLMALASQSKV